MSKKHNHEGEAAPAPHQSITVQKVQFTVPAPYAEGHVLTAVEAVVLNTTYAENLRNNFASKVAKAKEDAGGDLSQEAVFALQAALTEYAASYTFQGKREGGVKLDPVTRLATTLAREAVKNALRAKNVDAKSLPEGKMDEMVAALLEKRPHFREEAERRIKSAQNEASEVLEGIL